MATLSNPLESTLSSVQIDAVTLLASGASITTAATQTGVHRATIHNWLKLTDFHAALHQATRDYADAAQAKLREIAVLALDTIRHTLTDPAISPAIKLKAALAVLDRSLFPKPEAPTPEEFTAPKTAESIPTGTPRNAACPCGSGNKFKRCCGTNAPPQLGIRVHPCESVA
jgi:uncharacterized protein YchJ